LQVQLTYENPQLNRAWSSSDEKVKN